MVDVIRTWIRIFTFLLFIAAIVYYIWMQKQMRKKVEKRKGKANYTIKQMKEIK